MVLICLSRLSSTASNSNRSSPACSPVLRKRCRSPILQNVETDNMVEKGSEHNDTSKSPSTPEQLVTRTFSGQSTRSGGKNSKVCPPPHPAPPVGFLSGSPPTPVILQHHFHWETCCVLDMMHLIMWNGLILLYLLVCPLLSNHSMCSTHLA